MLHQSKLFLAAMATTITVCASAQVTTSAVSGQVIDETGQAVIGATVLAVHDIPFKVCVPEVRIKSKSRM